MGGNRKKGGRGEGEKRGGREREFVRHLVIVICELEGEEQHGFSGIRRDSSPTGCHWAFIILFFILNDMEGLRLFEQNLLLYTIAGSISHSDTCRKDPYQLDSGTWNPASHPVKLCGILIHFRSFTI